MSILYLVRHGQARFLTDDYDRLSDLGRAQGRSVGGFFASEGIVVDKVWTGTLRRQVDTAAEAAEEATKSGATWPKPEVLPGLNEYPAEAIQETIAPQLAERDSKFAGLLEQMKTAADGRERYRVVHLVLEAVMDAWIDGAYDAPELTTWSRFSSGVTEAFAEIMKSAPRSSTSVVVTSGGPIGIAVQTVLQAPARQAARLNWRVYNASLTRFTFSGPRITMDQFNAIPHLVDPAQRSYR